MEKGDCAYFPSLLAEMSRPVGTAQVGPINSLLRSIERKGQALPLFVVLGVSGFVLDLARGAS